MSVPIRPYLQDTPAEGQTAEIMPGLTWLRTPLPYALNHVNLWLLEGADGVAGVDAGLNQPVTRDGWDRALAAFGGKPLTDVFITHCHPDHLGLAGWLAERHAPRFYMTPREEATARRLCDDAVLQSLLPRHLKAYAEMGLAEAPTREMMERMGRYKYAVSPLPAAFTSVQGGDIVKLGDRDWQVIEGYGHSPQHASLYDTQNDVFIAGDQVLPYISPNISVTPRDADDADPLAGFFESLARIKTSVPDSALVLPMHGVPFHGLHDRIDVLTAHHHERLAQVERIVAGGGTLGLSAAQVMGELFSGRHFGPSDIFFALGEAMSHIRYLMLRDKLAARADETGVLRYFPA